MLSLKRIWNDFITSGWTEFPTRPETFQKLTNIKFINFFSLVGIFIIIGLALIDIFNFFLWYRLVIYGLTALFLIFNLHYIRRTKDTDLTGAFLLISLFMIIFLVMLPGKITNLGILIVLAMPFIVFYLKGQKKGAKWLVILTVLYLTMSSFIITGIIPSNFTAIELIMTFTSFAIISISSYFLERRNNEKSYLMQYQIYTDELTGLPSRQKLLKDIENEKDKALLLINIDDFKELNDIFGYKVGDHILFWLSVKLSQVIDERKEQLYKLAADEYAILIDLKEDDEVRKMLEIRSSDLLDYIDGETFPINEYNIKLRVTIGISFRHNGNHKREDLFARADIALKTAKRLRKSMMFYDEASETTRQFQDHLIWVPKLLNAIEDDRIVPFFQPIINNQNGKVEKYECLMRMIIENDQVISPAYFLDFAKKIRAYTKLSEIMLRKSINRFLELDYEFSINVSVEDILDKKTLPLIRKLIQGYPELSKRLVFEIVESEEIENYVYVYQFVQAVRDMNCKVAIDDFGSGYSNFGHIMKLNVDYIKFDSSLIQNIDHDRNSQIIVENLVSFSRQMNKKTIAEFVHSEAVYEMVKKLGVDYSQGYYLGKPHPDISIEGEVVG